MAAVAIIEATSAQFGNGDSDVARAAAGDRIAFERLYREQVNRVYSLCARMVSDRDRAEELTQDVFVRAWEKLHLFRGESSFSTWLHRLTVNVVLNSRKSEGRQRSRYEENDEDAGMDALPPSIAPALEPVSRFRCSLSPVGQTSLTWPARARRQWAKRAGLSTLGSGR